MESGPETSRRRLSDRLFAPVDIAPLAYFRVAFGLLLACEAGRFLVLGWVGRYYLEPGFLFKYYGFEWVRPWPGIWLYVHFVALGICALCVAAGLLYRITAPLLFLGIGYVFLLDQSRYLNHLYLVVLLAFLVATMPAHRAVSLDALRRPGLRSTHAPAWTLWLLRAQMAVVYVFGGIAKINEDWLKAQPLDRWLPRRADLPVIGALLEWPATAWFFSYTGLLFDLFCIPALLWRRTRLLACVAVLAFHLLNAAIFSIGIFPWLALAATALLFLPGWPLAWRHVWSNEAAPSSVPGRLGSRLIPAFVGLWLVVQLAVPLRHWLYPGDVAWTEQGHRFSWRMKLRDKTGTARIVATDPSSGERWIVDHQRWLDPTQYGRMCARPDMIQQFARWVAMQESERRGGPVEIRVEASASLNGRRSQPLIDPAVDLSAEPVSLRPARWIVPLRESGSGTALVDGR